MKSKDLDENFFEKEKKNIENNMYDNSHMFNEEEKENNNLEDNSYMFEEENDEYKRKIISKSFDHERIGIKSLIIGISALAAAGLVGCAIGEAGASYKLEKEIDNKKEKNNSTNGNTKKKKEINYEKQKEEKKETSFTIDNYKNPYEKSEYTTQEFMPGEHAVYVPITEDKDVRKLNYRYEYHEGYKPVKIQIESYGDEGENFGGGYVEYINTEPVECKSNLQGRYGHYVYLDFGKPSYKKEEKYKRENNEFDVGQHIISIPIYNTYGDLENFKKVNEHKGYKIIDICGTAYGKNDEYYAGGVALYINTVPVTASKYSDDIYKDYQNFGYPIEKPKTKTLK